MATPGLTQVQTEITHASGRAGIDPHDVCLVVVSKGRSAEEVAAVAGSGHRVFGENRQQGLAARLGEDLPDDIVWHFIGPLQSRKARFVAEHAALLHSMDRMSLVPKWANAGSTPVLLQFNLGTEPQKSGFHPDNADRVIDEVLAAGLDVRGVMSIPPFSNDPEMMRPYFARLRGIFDTYRDSHGNMSYCSMGMSNDFAVAIEEGSTMVRVGRAIFEPTDL